MKTDQPMNEGLDKPIAVVSENGLVFYLNENGKYQRLDASFQYTIEQIKDFTKITEVYLPSIISSKLKEKEKEIEKHKALWLEAINTIDYQNDQRIILESQLQASNAMAERLAETVEDMLNCCDMDSTSFVSYNKILTEYKNSKK